jgi:hypothetical protein
MLTDEKDDFHGLSPSAWTAAAQALKDHGVVLLRGLVSPEQVSAIRARLHVHSSAIDKKRAGKEANTLVREFDSQPLYDEDPELDATVTSTFGRQHLSLRKRPIVEDVMPAQVGAMPLIWEHLCAANVSESLPYVSEVQLLLTEPCAVDQFWHVDNANHGLTVFIPLTPVPADIGPTLFLPGSHHLFDGSDFFGRVTRLFSSLLSSDGVAVGTMNAGDCLIYDSRIIHRGAANMRYDKCRVALVYRYDYQRPPGQTAMGTQLVSWTGSLLAALQRGYAALPT